MKWRSYLLFSLAALLITGAFVIPSILLRKSISQSLDKPFLTDAPATDIKSVESIAEKLISFSDPESTSVSLGLEEDVVPLLPVLHRELKILCDSGAIPETVYDSLNAGIDEGFDAGRHFVIQPGEHLMFEVLVIEVVGNEAQLLLDWSSEKILGMGYSVFNCSLLPLECDNTQANLEMQGWAAYLELKPGQSVLTELNEDEIAAPGERRDPLVLKQITLADESGTEVLFCQSFASWENKEKYTWSPIY